MEFTSDWFNGERPAIWSRLLTPWAGRADLKVLEIGSYEGRSAMWFLTNLVTHPQARLVCIDSWADGGSDPAYGHLRMSQIEARFDRNTAPHSTRLLKWKSYSTRALANCIDRGVTFDLIYVDGCHEQTQAAADIVMGFEVLVPGGILIVDDINHPHYGLGTVFERWVHERSGSLTVLHRGVQGIVQKKASHE